MKVGAARWPCQSEEERAALLAARRAPAATPLAATPLAATPLAATPLAASAASHADHDGLDGRTVAADALPHGVVTFLFADIEGSTQLLHQLGARYAGALADAQALLRGAL